ncbi:MAG TPA: hypothetical protein VKP67_18550 [Xanthobacteraceae bacterium]|nr:hypothetical protein [Xanthobacteraceae bacterium]
MSPTDIPAIDHAEARRAKISYRRPAKGASGWRESVPMRFFVGAALFAIPLFIYGLMSFPNPLQPLFTTTEALLALALLGLVIGFA